MENEYKYLDLLEKLNKKLDPKQKKVCTRTDNTVVAAGAGSGKTQVLATRFAWLVMSCNIPCSKILTLTFTKKATGEMYERIHKTLTFFAEQEETPEPEKSRAKEALKDFSNVHIQTFDSYCTGIVKSAATSYGIRPNFSTGSGDSESDIRKQVLPFVFENRESLAVKTFAPVGNYQDFASSILAETIIKNTSIVTPENYFVNFLSAQKKEIVRAWNFIIGGPSEGRICPELLKDSYEEHIKEFPDCSCLKTAVRSFLFEFSELPDSDSKPTYIQSMKAYDTFKNIRVEDYLIPEDFDAENPDKKVLSKIKELLSLMELFEIKYSNAKIYKALWETIKPLKPVSSSRRDIFLSKFLHSISAYIEDFNAIKSLNQLFDRFTLLVNRQKRLSGNLTFKDVTELSLDILTKQKEIRKQEKNAFDKIMIDEFQDNNGKNRDLLFLISEKDFPEEKYGCRDGIPDVKNIKTDKLFFVGDEKQSIYKFRGAEVSVFNRLKTDLGEENFLQMEYNYRSDNELLTGFNRLFGKESLIFSDDAEKDFEARYISKAVKFVPAAENEDGTKGKELPEENLTLESSRIHLCALNTKNPLLENDTENLYLDTENQTAFFIAKQINKMMNENDRKGQKRRYSDFAILDRTRKRKNLLKWLNYFGIPYKLDQNTGIFTDGPVNDIYSFLRLCVYPEDKNAFAVYLSSPFCNLDQKALETVLLSCTPNALPETEEELSKIAETILGESSDEMKKHFVKGINYFKTKSNEILSQNLSTTINDLWHENGYLYTTMENLKTSLYAELFDFLFELARQCDQNGKNIGWFVDQLDTLKDKEKGFSSDDEELDASEVTYPLESEDAVQIMTIHKSKGLQFENVFICGIMGAGHKADKAKVFFDEEFGASICPVSGNNNFFAITQKSLFYKKELAEFRRVIYVAITRAVRDVYIAGSYNPQQKNTVEAESDTQMNLLEQTAVKFYGNALPNFEDGKEYFGENPDLPFTYESILPFTKKDAFIYGKEHSNPFERDSGGTRIYEDLPSDTEILAYEEDESLRRTPSSLEKESGYSEEKYNFSDDTLQNAGFSGADFGTLVHEYLRAQAEGVKPEEYSVNIKLLKNLSEFEITQTKELCIKMCRDFKNSRCGKEAYGREDSARIQNRFIKAEWAFKMFHENAIWTGSIDLIYEKEDGTYSIIDYKSDTEIHPEIYYGQQKCYRIAASKLLNIDVSKISCSLWYLRHNTEINITEYLK